MKYKIIQKRALCIGCGACVACCDNWEMSEDNKARPKTTIVDDKDRKEYLCNKEAVEICPVKCIELKSSK